MICYLAGMEKAYGIKRLCAYVPAAPIKGIILIEANLGYTYQGIVIDHMGSVRSPKNQQYHDQFVDVHVGIIR